MSKKLVIDSSVIILLSRRGKLEQYLKQKKNEGYDVLIPQAISKELIDEPRQLVKEIRKQSPALAEKITRSIEEISASIDRDLIKVENIDYRRYSEIIDNVRKHLSQLEAKKEHTIKKGDPELIVLTIQLYDRFKETIFVSTKDKGLLRALEPFRDKVEYEILENP